jgi:protein gp37
MGDQTNIQWTNKTWNPWHGCKKVSAGCKFCYMFREKEKYGQNGSIIQRSKTKFFDPLKWTEPEMVFTCSWSDWFIEEADAWRDEAWRVIKKTPHLTYQILTKRPERILEHLPADWGEGYPNVWLGVSVENQDNVGRIKILESIPAKIKFISFEPLIGPLTSDFVGAVDWIIIGGESGNDTGYWRYRQCALEWIERLVDGYRSSPHQTAIFVKQMGTYLAKLLQMTDNHGGNIYDFPTYLRIREFPKQ